MSKKIVCFLLALIMVLGLIPNAAITANAASKLNTSENARKILEGYYKASFLEESDGSYIGYHTPVSYEGAKNYLDGITKDEALDLMNEYITKDIDKKINAYTESMNLTLSASQHDALAIHTYRAGSFAAVNGALKEAIRNGLSGNDMVAAFVEANNVGLQNIRMDVALSEAAVYLFGVYGYNGGSKLSYAKLDTNGDNTADKAVGYVTSTGYTLPEAGANALGWYVYDSTKKTTTGSAITKLTSSHNGKLIVAKQQDGGNNMPAEYTLKTSTLADLNVYTYGSAPVKTDKVLKANSDFKVTQEYLDENGVKWVYGTGTDSKGKTVTGWVNTGSVAVGEDAAAKPIASATVTAAKVDIYEGATTKSNDIGDLYKNDNVKIYEQKMESTNSGNISWGKILIGENNYGWINLAYTSVSEYNGESGSVVGETGKIVNTDKVNIRAEAGTTETLLTTLKRDTKVTVLELKNVGGAQWGKIKWTTPSSGYTQGWVYMHYVQLDSAFQGTAGSSTNNGTVKYTGVVTSNINLNVRKSADIYSTKVGSLANGTKINVYEVKTSKNMKWGRIGTDQWVCLSYVSLTEVAQPSTGTTGSSSTTTSVQATVKASTLDVYKNYNSNSQKVGTLNKGDVVTILERNTENTSTGSRIWGRFDNGTVSGWINLAYTDVKTVTSVTGGSTGTTTGTTSNANGADAVVANCISVNVRSAAGVYNTQITKLNNGTKIKVYDRVTKDNAPWAKITWDNGAKEGWVCMNYVTMSASSGTAANGTTVGATNSNTISVTGYVNSNVDLKVRAGAGLGYAQIGALKKGTKVSVYEQMTADGLIWGRTTYGESNGWICMSYITVENTSSTGKGIMGTVARCFAAVNVRSAPGTNNALVAKINVGTRVEVFETKTYSNQLWGRVAQGWVCMDYVLLDSELPEGTILDATVPTTQPTQPGATTEPDDGLNLAGAVSCSVAGATNKDLVIFNDADDDSQEVGSIKAGKDITVVGVKKNGTEVWGLINQNGTQGWINLDNNACGFYGYVTTNDQPVYESASADTIVGELDAPYFCSISKLGTNGSEVFGWVGTVSAWVPVSKLSATEPEATITTYEEYAGSGSITRATTTALITAYKNPNTTSKEVFKLAKGCKADLSDIDFVGTKIWGLIEEAGEAGWIDLSSTYFDLKVEALEELTVYTDRNENKPLTDKDDETVEITVAAGDVLYVRTLKFDSNGNIFAEIINTGAALNNNFIIIRQGNGMMNVDFLNNVPTVD